MFIVKVIKFLKETAESLRVSAIQKKTNRIEQAAEQADVSEELVNERIELAEAIYNKMVDRANDRHTKSLNTLNRVKEKAYSDIEELEGLS